MLPWLRLCRAGLTAPAKLRGLNQLLSSVFHDLYATLIYKVRAFAPCYICGVRPQIFLPDTNEVEIVITCMAVKQEPLSDDDESYSRCVCSAGSVQFCSPWLCVCRVVVRCQFEQRR